MIGWNSKPAENGSRNLLKVKLNVSEQETSHEKIRMSKK